jgi:hypothetical protein
VSSIECAALALGDIVKAGRRRIMTITVDPAVEARLRERAEAEGLSVADYVVRLVQADQSAEDELERPALEGLNSGEPFEAGPGYWEEKHRRLGQRLRKPSA